MDYLQREIGLTLGCRQPDQAMNRLHKQTRGRFCRNFVLEHIAHWLNLPLQSKTASTKVLA